jgi:anti-sigma-K factor RskA
VTIDRDTAEALAVQYVLGELPADEAVAFEREMATDAALATEVKRLRGVLGLIPLATAMDPPPGLRARVLAAAEEQRRAPAARRAPRRIVWSRFAAAAAAALALALGIDSYRVRRELRLQQELAQTLVEPDVVHRFAMAGAAGSYGKVALDMDAKRGAVVLARMADLPAGQVYRLWAQVGEKSVFCGDFHAKEGDVQAQFAVPVESYTAPVRKLFVTVEPAGPPGVPTGPHVMESV